MIIEVCTYSLASAITAQQAGADRIELCGGRLEGGTTPSAGLIQSAILNLDIPIVVMIRPREGDFCYSKTEIEEMKYDLEFCKKMGVKEVIFGVLKPDGTVNIEAMKALMSIAKPMKVSFHRAFDMVFNTENALEDIIALGCHRILTSGRENNVFDGLEMIEKLLYLAQNRIEIMAGSGVNASNVLAIKATGVDAIHLSGSEEFESAMTFRNTSVSMANASSSNEYVLSETSFDKIKNVVSLIIQSK